MSSRILTVMALLALSGCTQGMAEIADNGEIMPDDDLPLGAQSADDKADRNWTNATRCKDIPTVPVLQHPQIVISIDGLTLHLFDTSAGYDRVFPIGPGQMDASLGESLSYYPLNATAGHDFTVNRSRSTACKIWWTDPGTGAQSPVFAGLPFLSWYGPYGIHGPIDNYTAENGGTLRRGFVSHGCIRMEAADILEVYARTKGITTVPVHVQREPERSTDGTRVNLENTWIGAECAADADCNYTGGFCHVNSVGGRGFCSAHCTRSCADRAGNPETFCVTDPDAQSSQGMCVPKETSLNSGCRTYDHMVPRDLTRNGDASRHAIVCVPGSPGFVGDRCLATSDCEAGLTCASGVCTTACTTSCADAPGYATTYCVNDERLGQGGSCARTCTPSENATSCPMDSECTLTNRNGSTTKQRYVCLPTQG